MGTVLTVVASSLLAGTAPAETWRFDGEKASDFDDLDLTVVK